MRRLHVNGRYLEYSDGEPFMYLGDTAWELAHRLTREEINIYMDTRASQGFTAVQIVALAEKDGLRAPNAYGRIPLFIGSNGHPNPLTPDDSGDYSYWRHLDYAVSRAADRGLFVSLLPTWGDKFLKAWGEGPEIFNEGNAYEYGKWIGARFCSRENIIWMLGGDRKLDARSRPIIDSMARGIKESDGNHLITFHPPGGQNSLDFLSDANYIDFHTAQTGHDASKSHETYIEMEKMRCASDKPYMDSEPRYEDHPACFRSDLGFYWSSEHIRQNAYWNIMSGACGHTYGNHNVWSFNVDRSDYFPYHWLEALRHDAAEQMKYLKRLRFRGDYRSFRPAADLIECNYEGDGHMTAARGDDYAYVYSPLGAAFTLRLSALDTINPVKAIWFNPRSGEETPFNIYSAKGATLITPPAQATDWVLILEFGDRRSCKND